jgi:hypothetical protein
MIDDDYIKLNFMKLMKRYGSWTYRLLDEDYIIILKPKKEKIFIMSIYINNKSTTYKYGTLQDTWNAFLTEIDKYEEENRNDGDA